MEGTLSGLPCRILPSPLPAPPPAGLAAHTIVFLGYATIKLIIIIDCVDKVPLPNCWGRVNSSRDGAMLPFGGNKQTPPPSGLGLRFSRYSAQHRSRERATELPEEVSPSRSS